MSKKITNEEFIKELKEKWGDKYDFSKVNYVNARTKVCIVCPKHGEYWTYPVTIKTCGCRKCSIEKQKLKLEEFVKRARKLHGDKYDYSKVEYVNALTKVCIICPEHGEFWQTPASHLNGIGCPKCGIEVTKDKTRRTLEEFIEKAKKVHDDKYDYSKVEYVNNRTKVCIICPEHGEFWQTPSSHLRGAGCKKCLNEKLSSDRLLTTEEFIERARKIHGNKYNYSKIEYKGYYEKVCIICPEHGEFWQLAYNHLQGKGCGQCKMSQLENRVNQLLLKNKIKFEYNIRPDFLKNGKSYRSLDFYLPDYNIAIECQGIQHFSDSKYYKRSGDKAYQDDKLKYEDCKKQGIKIIYFSNYIIDNYIDTVFNNENDLLNEILKYDKKLL